MAKAKKGVSSGGRDDPPSRSGAVRGPVTGGSSIEWTRLIAGAGLGVLAELLVGVMPLYDPWFVRALVCALVVGLSVRGLREIAPAAGLAAAAGVAAMPLVALVQTQSESAGPAAADVLLVLAVCATMSALVGLICAGGRVRTATLLALAIVVGLQLYQTGVLPGAPRDALAQIRQRVGTEPAAERYAFDGDLFIKVDHLMARGVPYYTAFLRAFDEDQRLQGPPPGLFNVRQRWLFELWNVLPGPPGLRVLYWFQVLVAGTMLAGYALARRFVEPAAALLAPIAIGGYMLIPAATMWFPLSEYWGGMVGVFFLYAMVTERWTWAAVLAVAAFAFRELMLFLVPIYVVWWLVSRARREGIAGLVIALCGPAALLGLHALWSPVSGQSPEGASHWLQGGFDRLFAALHFSGALVRSSGWVYLAIPLLALAGALMTRTRWTRILLSAAVAVPVIALMVFSGGQWNDYWGAIAMPMLLALAPLAAGLWVPSAQALLDAPATPRSARGAFQVLPRGGDPAARAAFEEAAKAAWEAGADVVVASRLAPGARLGGSLGERLAGWTGVRVLSALCRCVCPIPGLRDVAPPFALIDAELLQRAPADVRTGLTSAGPASAAFLLWAREHARVSEVPLREPAATGALPWGLFASLAAARLRELVAAS